MRRGSMLVTLASLGVSGAVGLVAAGPALGAGSRTMLYASPTGSGQACLKNAPCSLSGAKQAMESHPGGGVTVTLAGGTYRLSAPLQFGSADSGTSAAPNVFKAALGARPVVSGGVRVTGWTESDASKGIWSAKVPAGTTTRQVYIDGQDAPVAQASVSSLGLDLSDWDASGFNTSGSTAAYFASLSSAIGPSGVSELQFEWNPMQPTDWEESDCPAAAIGESTITMAQPCWNNLTNKAPTIWGGNSSNITPYSLAAGTAPTVIENAYPLLHPGQWYLDDSTNTLYYMPTTGQDMSDLDVEVPQVQSLMQVTGTLRNPVHDLRFEGITFSTATWMQPSTDVGFAQVQDNLSVTGSNNQGECNFVASGTPAGSCPWGGFTEPLAGVQLTAADDVAFSGDTFTDLGGIGLGLRYGSDDDLIQGNTFTGISSSALWLGCSGDPDPTDATTDPASAVISLCGGPGASGDSIGANEIMTGNTVSDNVIYNDATDYIGAAGVTLMFTQHTTIAHNDIFDMPYDGITSGAWEGHPDTNPTNYDTTTNINADNRIIDNVLHNNMQTYGDGGDIYTEGHQGITQYTSSGAVDRAASFAGGTLVKGNVADTDTPNYSYFYAPDAGSQWIRVIGNVEWNSHYSMSSHWPSAAAPYTMTTRNWFADPDDTPSSPGTFDNTQIPEDPGPADVPLNVLAAAGVQGRYRALEAAVTPSIYYSGASPADGSTPAQVLVAGTGFTPSTQIWIGGQLSPGVRYISPGFLVAQVPANDTDTGDVSLTKPSAPPPTIYPSLQASYDNVGVTDDSNTSVGNIDGNGYSFSAQALTKAGVTPGSSVTSSGVSFTFPGAVGSDDNTVAQGQEIAVDGTGSQLGFIIASVDGDSTGTGTIIYTDGTTQSYTLSAADWGSSPPAGSTVLAQTAYRNSPTGPTTSGPWTMYSASVALAPGKTVQDVVLPDVGQINPYIPSLHVFALGFAS